MTYPGQSDYQHVDDFFGGGSKSISFDADSGYQLGSWKGGTIISIRPKQQQTDYKTKAPLFWDDAKTEPKWTLPVEVQTDERDPQSPHDDGRRTLFISGGIERAVREHLRATNARLRPGGTIYAAWVSGAGKIGDAKQFQVHYTPAAESGADAMFGQQQQAPQQQHQAPPPQQAPGGYAQPPQQPGPYAQPPTPQQQYAQPTPPAPPAPAPQQQGGLWDGAAQPAGQWPAQGAIPPQQGTPPPPPAAPAQQYQQQPPPAAPPAPAQQPAPQQPAAPAGPNPASIDAAYAHLSDEQRAAIKASGMSPEQIAQVYGQPAAPIA